MSSTTPAFIALVVIVGVAIFAGVWAYLSLRDSLKRATEISVRTLGIVSDDHAQRRAVKTLRTLPLSDDDPEPDYAGIAHQLGEAAHGDKQEWDAAVARLNEIVEWRQRHP